MADSTKPEKSAGLAGVVVPKIETVAGLDTLGEDAARLRAALDRLNPRYQRAVALRYLADLDHADAAQAMGLTRPAFAVVLSRGLRALRRELGHAEGGDGIDG